MGWSGSTHHLLYVLRLVGADQSEDGKFKIYGEVTSFLGMGEDVVIGDDACYSKDGKLLSLAGLMGTTSYGLKVHVI